MLCLSGFELYSRWVPLFLKLVRVLHFFQRQVKGTVSQTTEAEYLKVNLPMLVLTFGL